jgi:hypothetical protein
MKPGVWVIFFIACAVVLVTWLIARYRYLGDARQARLALTADRHYHALADEYRRLSDMAITTQEHTDLRLTELGVQMDELRSQMDPATAHPQGSRVATEPIELAAPPSRPARWSPGSRAPAIPVARAPALAPRVPRGSRRLRKRSLLQHLKPHRPHQPRSVWGVCRFSAHPTTQQRHTSLERPCGQARIPYSVWPESGTLGRWAQPTAPAADGRLAPRSSASRGLGVQEGAGSLPPRHHCGRLT